MARNGGVNMSCVTTMHRAPVHLHVWLHVYTDRYSLTIQTCVRGGFTDCIDCAHMFSALRKYQTVILSRCPCYMYAHDPQTEGQQRNYVIQQRGYLTVSFSLVRLYECRQDCVPSGQAGKNIAAVTL